jgi:hypothetical protein
VSSAKGRNIVWTKETRKLFDVLPKTTLLKEKKSIGKISDWICQNSLLPANCLL